jgi:hypothetical protein
MLGSNNIQQSNTWKKGLLKATPKHQNLVEASWTTQNLSAGKRSQPIWREMVQGHHIWKVSGVPLGRIWNHPTNLGSVSHPTHFISFWLSFFLAISGCDGVQLNLSSKSEWRRVTRGCKWFVPAEPVMCLAAECFCPVTFHQQPSADSNQWLK